MVEQTVRHQVCALRSTVISLGNCAVPCCCPKWVSLWNNVAWPQHMKKCRCNQKMAAEASDLGGGATFTLAATAISISRCLISHAGKDTAGSCSR